MRKGRKAMKFTKRLMQALVEGVKTPRMWIFLWGGAGVLWLGFILISASLKPAGGSALSAGGGVNCLPLVEKRDPALLKGEMADFRYAFPARNAPHERILKGLGDGAKEVSLKDYRGKALLVNFWATWCAPCVHELPSLNDLASDLEGTNVEVIPVAFDFGAPDPAKTFFDQLGLSDLEFYSDETRGFSSAVGGVTALPVSILYDGEGREVGRLLGEADWRSDEAKALIKRTLGCAG